MFGGWYACSRVYATGPTSHAVSQGADTHACPWQVSLACDGCVLLQLCAQAQALAPVFCGVLLQALFCLGDLVWGHPQLQEQLAGQLAPSPLAFAQPGPGGRAQQQQHPIPYLQVRAERMARRWWSAHAAAWLWMMRPLKHSI